MLTRRTCSAFVLGCVLSVLAACNDAPTVSTPTRQAAPHIARSAEGLHIGQAAFGCAVARRALAGSRGWHTSRVTLYFSRSELAPDGSTTRYRYRLNNGQELIGAIDCALPKTSAAVRRVERHFTLVPSLGDASVMNQAIQLPGIEWGACAGGNGVWPDCDPFNYGPPPCWGSCADSPGGGGATSGGSGDSSNPLPGDADGDGDTLNDGPIAFTMCVAIKLSAGGWSAIAATGVSDYMAWDARNNSQQAYKAWADYRQNVENGVAEYNGEIERLYYLRWKDAEGQEKMLYGGTVLAAGYAALEIFAAAVACSPYTAAPV